MGEVWLWLVLGVIWEGLSAFVDVFGLVWALLKWVWADFGLVWDWVWWLLEGARLSRLRELLLRRSHCLRRL